MSNLATIVNNILADSGIDDINVVVTTGSYTNPSWIVSLPWTKITGTPTTLSGYGITDAYTQTQVNNLLAAKQNTLSLTTTGTSGAATLIGATLNIPVYQSVLTNPVTGTGSAGQVAYWSSGSAITGENNFIWDATNNRLAIGVVTPAASIHIEGSGSSYTNPEDSNVPGIYIYNTNSSSTNANTFLSLVTSGPSGGDPILSWDIDGVIGWSAGIDNSDSDKFKISHQWNSLDADTKFTIDGFGNIGVGTTTPNGGASERTIVLANNIATYYLTNTANTLRGIFALSNATSEVFIGTQTNHSFHLRTNDIARLWLTNGGNLGLGTTFVLGSYLSSATQSGVFQIATSVAKAATASDNILAFFGSNDATNPLGLFIGMQTGATVGARMVRLQGTEIGASANHILIQPDGGYVGIGNYFTSVNFYQPTTLLNLSNGNSSYTTPGNNNLPCIYLRNTNSASTDAHSILTLRTNNSTGGNPFISFDIEDVTGWAMGIDNADGDSFKLNHGWSSLTSNTALRFSITTLIATFSSLAGTGTRMVVANASGALSTQAITTGTVTSVGLSSATSGVTIGATPVTSSGTITLAIATASGSQQGLLSSTDWTTFNNKAPSVAGGYLPLSGGTLTGPLTGTRLTINSDDSGVIVDVAGRNGLMKYYLYTTGLVGANTGTDNSISTWLGRFSGTINAPTAIFQDLVVDNGGRIGIGTIIPATKLTLAGGDMNIDNSSSGNSYTLFFGNEVTRNSGKCIFMETFYLKIQGHRNEGIVFQGTDGSGNIQNFASFYGSANAISSTAVFYPSGGRLALGTTSVLGNGTSERTIHLAAAVNQYATFYITNSANTLRGLFAVGDPNSSVFVGSQTNHDFGIVTNDTTRLTVTSNGRLGIGTTFTIGGYLDSASQTGVIQQATNIAKASTARDVNIGFYGSNDASNPLGLVIKMRTGASTAARQMVFQGTEIGLSPNHILMQPDGANIGIGGYFNQSISNYPTTLLYVSNNNSSYTSPENNNLPCIYVSNKNSSSSTAHSILALRTLGASGGDPFISMDIEGIIGWSMGCDNSDGDKFKIANAWSALDSSTRFSMETGGNATFTGTLTANSFFESSDLRLKTLVDKEINYNAIASIEARYYKKGDIEELGYFAQDFEDILSSAISKNDKGYLNLSYNQVHTAKIAALEAKVKELESQLKNK